MRCSICDSTYLVGKDYLCNACRKAIRSAKKGSIAISEDELQEQIDDEHRSMNRIDTSVADYYSRKYV